ncbi:MAG TPA: radical SAM protein [Anaerolineales bacterium]|nr:radical SAM protein [Anaerolineales bacterium]
MTARVVLINPARHFIANAHGVGYLIPLGLVCIGGPLIDAGFDVKLIDHDLYGWSDQKLMKEVADFKADYILLGHSGSTAAHKTAIKTIRALHDKLPHLRVVYGGVYPSYAHQSIMVECEEIDAIVRGEGEQTVVGLIRTWEQTNDLRYVDGVTWRDGDRIVVNRSRTPIKKLDEYRPGWELVDWPRYGMFGFRNAAGLQFSRGCTLTCNYCGQWMFWKKWRHRSPENILEQLKILKEQYGVRIVWFADENFAADRETAKRLLKLIVEADLGLSLNLNMTAADVVRDADLLPLYKRAGVDYLVMGIESLKDTVVTSIRKNNPFEISKEAVRLLRENNIISLTNIIYGLEEESWKTIREKFNGLLELDSDILNAMYLTPHFWTAQGKSTQPERVIQMDQDKWSYRNQVLATRYLQPFELFVGVKLTEILFHLRPRALNRLFFGRDRRYLQIMRHSMWVGVKVILAEIFEFFFETKFSPQDSIRKLPGTLLNEHALSGLESELPGRALQTDQPL